MKKSNLWLGILAIALVFTMTVLGCDNASTDGGGSGGSTNDNGGGGSTNDNGGGGSANDNGGGGSANDNGGGGSANDNGGGDNGDNGNISLGSTLTITNAQVYSKDENGQLVKFTGTVDLSYVYNGYDSENYQTIYKSLNELIDGSPTVTITEGKLNFTLGTPKATSLSPLVTSSMPQGITVSTTDVKIFTISSFSDSTGSTSISQRRLTDGQSSVGVMYFYSNKDVNISGTGTSTYPSGDGDKTYTSIITYKMNLKAGWNSVFTTLNQTTETAEGTTTKGTYQTGTPPSDYKWVINQY